MASQFSEQLARSDNSGRAIWLQKALATVLAFPALCFLFAGFVMVADIIQGELKMMIPFVVVPAIACSCGALSYSLFRGRGVPCWFLRAFWITITAGVIYFTACEFWKYLKGEQVDLAGDLLIFGVTIYFCFSTFKVFWASKIRQPT